MFKKSERGKHMFDVIVLLDRTNEVYVVGVYNTDEEVEEAKKQLAEEQGQSVDDFYFDEWGTNFTPSRVVQQCADCSHDSTTHTSRCSECGSEDLDKL
jgi:hypothetical protein